MCNRLFTVRLESSWIWQAPLDSDSSDLSRQQLMSELFDKQVINCGISGLKPVAAGKRRAARCYPPPKSLLLSSDFLSLAITAEFIGLGSFAWLRPKPSSGRGLPGQSLIENVGFHRKGRRKSEANWPVNFNLESLIDQNWKVQIQISKF